MKDTCKFFCLHKAASSFQKRIYNYINRKIGYNKILCDRLRPNSDLSDAELIVIRHPLNKLISQYYSFGWTHVSNIQPKFKQEREEIRNKTLEGYITGKYLQTRQVILYNLAYQHLDKIVKYEDIMDNPQEFITYILRKIDALQFFDEVWNEFGGEFTFSKPDLSDEIINNNLITHRRNLDHTEYKKKLPSDILTKLSPDMVGIIGRYEKIISVL